MHFVIVILGLAVIGLVFYMFHLQGKLSEMKKDRKELMSELETRQTTINSLRDRLNKKTREHEGDGLSRAKAIVMYRKPETEAEIKSGVDLVYVMSFASYRQAAGMTGIKRHVISKSVKSGNFVKHPRSKTMVRFAPEENDLNSSEKKTDDKVVKFK